MRPAELFISELIGSALLVPMDGQELLHHLIVDKLVKIGIVLAALVVVAIGMAVIWRRSGPGRS